jgi:Na+/H+ antiporter NhaC
MALFLRQAFVLKGINSNVFGRGVWEGIKSMLPAVYILLFAWAIVDLIGRLETGTYLAGIVESSNMSTSWLPIILFLIAGIMAFSTGTSWGSFGILLPIAGDIAAATDINLLLPALAAVLAGAVFGDHCSPISDTTILSSTGAGCNHIDHVMTQIPYALISAGIASVGYLIIGFTGSTIFALLAVAVLVIVFALAAGNKKDGKMQEKTAS